MKTAGTTEPRAHADQAIDITKSFDVTFFSTRLRITPECLRAAVNAAGPKLGDVRRYLEGARIKEQGGEAIAAFAQ